MPRLILFFILVFVSSTQAAPNVLSQVAQNIAVSKTVDEFLSRSFPSDKYKQYDFKLLLKSKGMSKLPKAIFENDKLTFSFPGEKDKMTIEIVNPKNWEFKINDNLVTFSAGDNQKTIEEKIREASGLKSAWWNHLVLPRAEAVTLVALVAYTAMAGIVVAIVGDKYFKDCLSMAAAYRESLQKHKDVIGAVEVLSCYDNDAKVDYTDLTSKKVKRLTVKKQFTNPDQAQPGMLVVNDGGVETRFGFTIKKERIDGQGIEPQVILDSVSGPGKTGNNVEASDQKEFKMLKDVGIDLTRSSFQQSCSSKCKKQELNAFNEFVKTGKAPSEKSEEKKPRAK